MTAGVSGWVPLLSGLTGAVLGPLIVWGWPKIVIRFRRGKRPRVQELRKLQLNLTIAEAKLTVVKTENDEYKREVEDKETELSQLRKDYSGLKRTWGKFRIEKCGVYEKSLGLSVAVQFMEPRDAELADQIRGFFWMNEIPLPGFPWTDTRDIVQISWFKNPSSTARIVIFSDHTHAAGIKAAFNGCDLLDEPVDRFEMSFAGTQQADIDIAIVVFPTKTSSDVKEIRTMTQGDYDALPSKDEKTLYFITDKHKD